MPPAREPSKLELALLGVIQGGPQSGYDLRKAFTATPLAHFSDSPGAIYPALARLRGRGFVEPAPRERSDGRRRVAFRLSAAGKRAFLAWLRRPPAADEVASDMDAVLLRFAFMSQAALKADEIRRFLDDLEALLAAHLGGLEIFLEANGGAMPPTGRLALECGLELVRGYLRWTAHAREQTGAPPKGEDP